VIFDNLDGVLVRRTILRMDGAAGPSGLDVSSWKKLCSILLFEGLLILFAMLFLLLPGG